MLKWAVTEHFKEYLPYQPFLVKTDNNPLIYIMKTPNLNATGHQWAGALTRFNFQLEYQKGWDNTMADLLSQITTCLSPEAMWSVLNGVTLGSAHRAEGYDPVMVEGDHGVEKRYVLLQGGCWLRGTWLIGLKHRKRTQCWMLCWTGCKLKRRPIWRHS